LNKRQPAFFRRLLSFYASNKIIPIETVLKYMSFYDREIQYIKGVGEKRAKLFHNLGINTVGDLIHYYPRDYEDFSLPCQIKDTLPGDIHCIRATVTAPARISLIRRGMTLYKFKAADDTAVCDITFFNNKYITDMLKVGQSYYFYGKIGGSLFKREMVSPEFESGSVKIGLRPIYPLTAGLSSRNIAAAVKQALTLCAEDIFEFLPDWLRKKYDLCHIDFALENIHFPKDRAALETARRRLVFEELLTLQIGLSMLRKRNAGGSATACAPCDFAPFYEKLPFEPTGAQIGAINQGAADMNRNTPMNRLVEGDVGSGKTAVAAALCWFAAQSGLQSALMAPTEILAQQHFKTLNVLLSPCGISVGLLTGSMAASEKKRVTRMLKTHQIDVVVGTHALLSDGVDFEKLGFVITDEQHRFGVGQRAALVSKGTDPHVLVMSATPIPRTLGLIIYGDLDISILNEMPKGRQTIKTYAVDSGKRLRVYDFIKKQIKSGLQAYIVCPLVEEGEDGSGLASATQYAEKIAKEDFEGYKVGLLHGRLKATEKNGVMREFVDGSLDLLVATTVIEVGVDVPNAVVMVIENAERFGLSQLHQLRGRVGRGASQSYCMLISDAHTKEAAARLHTMCETSDGFKIAEKDLELRGIGDFFGSRQHGLPEFKIADVFSDMDTIKEARLAANEIISDDPLLEKSENVGLKSLTNKMFSKEDVVFN
jgi:ATP-dependent DNA helicase RecG